MPGTIAALLVIEIPQGTKAGRYVFQIGVKLDGNDHGTLPCTIEITP